MLIDPSRRRFTQWACASGLLPWLASCGGGSDESYPFAAAGASFNPDYGRAVVALMSTYQLPGVLAGVRVAGRPEWTQAFGRANLSMLTPLSLASTFPVRSVTKSFTVTTALQLVRDGLLGVNDTIDRYVAGVPNGNLITLADLAGNQSGLVDYSAQKAFLDVFIADTLHVFTPKELVAFSLAVPPTFAPGAQYQYSNTNTVLLGLVIEAVTGQPLGEVMTARIFRPLALNGTSYPTPAALPPPAPTPYAVNVNTGESEVLPLISPTALAGSGAITATLPNLLAWGDELGRGSLIGDTLQALRKARSRPATNGPEYDRYGLGIGRIGNWWGHTGSGLGFQIATMNLAARGATISVMVNATPEGGDRRDLNFAQEVFEALAVVVEAG